MIKKDAVFAIVRIDPDKFAPIGQIRLRDGNDKIVSMCLNFSQAELERLSTEKFHCLDRVLSNLFSSIQKEMKIERARNGYQDDMLDWVFVKDTATYYEMKKRIEKKLTPADELQ